MEKRAVNTGVARNLTPKHKEQTNHQALLEVAGAQLNGHVHDEDKVREAVAAEPEPAGVLLQLREALPHDQRPQVVQDGDRDRHQPVEVKVLVRVDDGLGDLQPAPAPHRFVRVRRALRAGVLDGFLTGRVGKISRAFNRSL